MEDCWLVSSQMYLYAGPPLVTNELRLALFDWHHPPPIAHVLHQLAMLCDMSHTITPAAAAARTRKQHARSVHTVYEHINRALSQAGVHTPIGSIPTAGSAELGPTETVHTQVVNILGGDVPWIWTNGGFQKVAMVATNARFDCRPYLFTTDLAQQYPALFATLKVRVGTHIFPPLHASDKTYVHIAFT